MEKIIIPFSKKKLALLFLGVMGFVIVSFWLFQNPEMQTRYNPQYIKILSVVSILFSSFCGIYILMKFFDKKPGLIIYDEGIIDNSSSICLGLIKWENITDIKITKIRTQKILTIEINNADEIISQQRGLKKMFMKLNKKYFHSPIQITSNSLACSFQELHEIIQDHLTARKIL